MLIFENNGFTQLFFKSAFMEESVCACVCMCVRMSVRACVHMCASTCTHEHMHRVAMGFMRTLPQTELEAGSYRQNSFVSLMRILIFTMRSLPDLLQSVGGRWEDAFSLFKRSDTNR